MSIETGEKWQKKKRRKETKTVEEGERPLKKIGQERVLEESCALSKKI